jgi:serine/threonine-protein kinase HipA
VRKAFLRCVFNVVFNNRDDHAKNFALRMDDRMQWKFSPAYDLTFNHGPGGQHQSSIEGEGLAPARRELLKLAANSGVSTLYAEEVIDGVCVQATQLGALLEEFDIRATTRRTVTGAVAANAERCMTP